MSCFGNLSLYCHLLHKVNCLATIRFRHVHLGSQYNRSLLRAVDFIDIFSKGAFPFHLRLILTIITIP